MKKLFLLAYVALCGMTVKAATIDCTSLVDVTWGGAGVCSTDFAPAVTPLGYTEAVNMRQHFQDGSANATGVLISQTLTGLTNATYTVVLYANACCTGERDNFSYDLTDGATDVAYVFANGDTTAVTAKIATDTSANGEYTLTVEVTDGTLTMGIGKWKAGTNWHTIQIKSLTREATAQDAYETALAEAQALDLTQPMNAAVKSAMKTALNNYGTATEDTYETATTALNEATANVKASITAYATLKASIDFYAEKAAALDDAGKAAYDASSIEESYINGGYTDTEATGYAIDALAVAYRTAVASQTTAGTDMSDALINPDFEDGFTGWAYTNMQTMINGNLTNNFVERWSSSASSLGDASVKQSVTLNEGYYTLKAQVVARNLSAKLYVKVGSDTISVATDGAEQTYNSLSFQVTADATEIEVGYYTDGVIDGYSSGEGWFAIDNVSLTLVVKEVNETTAAQLIATIPDGMMNKDVKAAMNSAKTTLESEVTLDNYLALQEAIEDANASIEAYKTSRSVLDEVKSFLTSTWGLTSNVYSEDAFEDYEQQYNDSTLTDALAYGSVNSGVLPDVLLDGWDGRGAQDWAGGTLYINTWSQEGNSDGSNFVTPFYEVWNSDNSTLQAKTYTKTISGLETGKTYAVSAWVRVRISNDQSDALTGITLQAGDGDAVNVCTGEQVGSSQLYLDTFTAIGTADADGNLTVKFVVADSCNASWLSFKNVKCSRTVTISENLPYEEDDTTYYYATYCTPTAVDLDNCDFLAYAVTVSGTELTYTQLSGIVPASTPMVVKNTAAGTYAATIGLDEATEVTDNDLKASDGTIVGNGSTIYILGNSSDGVAWYFCAAGTTIAAGKCYLAVDANGVKSIGIHGTADAISSVATEQSKSCVRYNLSGQQVNNGYKGIVIENGKKYLVK